jgi:hypothetical protein
MELLPAAALREGDGLRRAPGRDLEPGDDGIDGALDLLEGVVELAAGVGVEVGHT